MLISFNQTTDRLNRTREGLWSRYNITPKGVLHIGGNRGEEAPVYLELGVTNQIWVEANPEIFIQLKETLKDNPDAIAFNYAIGEQDNIPVVLHIANNGGQSSSILNLGTHKKQHPDVFYTKDIEVTMRRIDSLIPEDTIKEYDFLNIDIQGYEIFALRGMGDYLKYFKWLYLEVNRGQVYEGCGELKEVSDYVARFGFQQREIKWVGNWGDALFCKI